MIIALSGMAQDPQGNKGSANSGKDTVADHLVDKYDFVKIALADPMKRICMEIYDFDEEQLWGPSPARNAPDKRYPREHTWGKDGTCACCGTPHPAKRVMPSGVVIEDEVPQCYLTPRYALQQLGTEWGRDCNNDTWVRYALDTANELLEDAGTPSIRSLMYKQTEGLVQRVEFGPMGEWERDDFPKNPPRGVVIPDVRYPNENNAVVSTGMAGVRVRIRRHVGELLPGAVGNHTSETSLIHFHDDGWDYVIENDSTQHSLLMKVDQMMAILSGRIIPYDDAQKDIPPFKRK